MLRLFSSIIIIISVAKFAHSGNHLKCGKNEILTKCENQVCEYRKCSDVGQPIECEKVDRKYCIKGCICKKNHLRATNGTCIPADQCPPSCGKNEIPTSCIEEINERRSCSDLSEPVSCVQVDQQFCTDGCLCKDGYLRNSYGICIPINKCPEAQCGDNEKFDFCPATCPGEECGSDPSLANCLPSPEPGSPSCQPSCRCCDGYKRNKEGCCIPEDKCPISCGVNEIPTACIQLKCELRDCSDIPKPVACVRVNPSSCTDGCLCADGYLRAKNRTCIPMNKCPEAQCGDNEKFDFCPAPCPGEECGADPSLANCLPSPEPGSPSCQPSCRCCDGYKRNKDGCCIPEDKCPPSIICGPNEEYNSCVNGNYCGRRNCSQPEIICIDLIEGGCIEGCLCKEGHLRAANGTCIPEDQCPLNCFGKNEVAGCQSTCVPQTCESIGRMYKCPEQTEECIQECRCKPGYYRNAIGECVSKADCLKCPGPNEYFSCGGACDNVCATLAIQNQTSCPIENVVCNPMCYCIEGYARDANNTCIPISKCPPPQPPNEVKCGPNAVYDSKCTESYPECPPEDCDICLQILCEPIPDPPGCRCVDNYLRNIKGLCVPSEQCETIPKRRPSKRRNKAVSSVKG